jgi:hypothetical protein
MKEICLAAVVCIGMMGVGWAEEENLSSTAITIASSARITQCTEMFAEFYVDPAAAENDVPPGYDVKIYPNGNALLLVMVQECEKAVLMGFLDVGEIHMSHIWIELDGPVEIPPPLPGTSGSYPTRYWYSQPMQMDNFIAKQAMTFAGIDTQWVPYITNGGPAADIRQGKVIESCLPWIQYAWTENSQLWESPVIVTGRQRFFRNYGLCGEISSEAVVTCKSHFLGDSTVVLDAGLWSQVRDLNLGNPIYGTTHPVTMDYCDASFTVKLFRQP